MPVGRRKNADPKWLLPLICRRGVVTKQDIGSIRIFDSETVFEIAEDLAESFLANARASEGGDVPIEPLTGDPAPAVRRPSFSKSRKPAYDPAAIERPAGSGRTDVKGAFGKARPPKAAGAKYPPKAPGAGKAGKAKPNKGRLRD
jgi:ATP-dependent RNA helicase DeaD